MKQTFSKVDDVRRAMGFLSLEETMDLGSRNRVLDPFSVLISAGIQVGEGNIFYPGVTLQADGAAEMRIGDENIFHSGTLFLATRGHITVGSHNQFGDGGFTAKSNRPGAFIEIGDRGRYSNNPTLLGQTRLGDGAQVLGTILVESCILQCGGSFEEPDPDLRAAVLKGWGVARNLKVARGYVINGAGPFDEALPLPQSHFHPKAT